ncbi:MAG: hypothetical protein R2867_28405 [Caldilineaceae bacterium]
MFVKNEVTVNNAVILDFIEPGTLVDGELELMLIECYAGNAQLRLAPAYRFKWQTHTMAGPWGASNCGLVTAKICGCMPATSAIESTKRFEAGTMPRGQCSYRPLARYHQLGTLWITCNPENLASRRSCELAGLTFTEIVKVPPSSDMYAMGDRQKCRYQMVL